MKLTFNKAKIQEVSTEDNIKFNIIELSSYEAGILFPHRETHPIERISYGINSNKKIINFMEIEEESINPNELYALVLEDTDYTTTTKSVVVEITE